MSVAGCRGRGLSWRMGEGGVSQVLPRNSRPKPQCDLVSEAVVQPAKWDIESAGKGI